MLALCDVVLYFGHQLGGDSAIEKIGKLGKKIGAGHAAGPPFFCCLK